MKQDCSPTRCAPLIHCSEKNSEKKDATLITSAGVTSGIDASLHMVTVVFGTHIAEKIIKRIEYPFSVEEIGKQVHIIP